MPHIKFAAKWQEMGQRSDTEKLKTSGFEPCTPEAVPQYTAWIREDLALSVALLTMAAEDVRWIKRYLLALLVVAVLIGLHVVTR